MRGIVVDIRNNGGGDDALDSDLWGYLTDRAFTSYGSMVIKVSEYTKKLYGREKYREIYGSKAWDAPNGTLVRVEIPPKAPTPNPLRYRGPVVLLIGTGTFSSAMECALQAKDFGLATVVGQETGEPVDSSGELVSGQSPRIGLDFSFPTKFFYGVRPRPAGQGVVPDVVIPDPPPGSPLTADLALDWAVTHLPSDRTRMDHLGESHGMPR